MREGILLNVQLKISQSSATGESRHQEEQLSQVSDRVSYLVGSSQVGGHESGSRGGVRRGRGDGGGHAAKHITRRRGE